MKRLNLDKNKRYILTCSYGPDSMALFDMLLKEGYDFVICHVNYHLREEEPEEVKDLMNICKLNNIKLYMKDFYMPVNANEEGWARQVRYDYFSELSKELGIKNVLVAHNEDDLIETYLLQKDRNNIVDYYGMKKRSKYKNATIIRPLLDVSKEELLQYCYDNKVHFGFDLSNFDIKFARNKIRKERVANLTDKQRKEILKNISHENKLLIEKRRKIYGLKFDEYIETEFLRNLDNIELNMFLIKVFKSRKYYAPVSLKFCDELLNIIQKNVSNCELKIKDINIIISYGRLYVFKELFFDKKKIRINKNSSLYNLVKNKVFEIVSNLPNNTIYQTTKFSKTIRRCFIDWKVPVFLRKVWPIVISKEKVVYIPHYEKDYKINKNSLLIFATKDFIK